MIDVKRLFKIIKRYSANINNLVKSAGLLKYSKELVEDISRWAIYKYCEEVRKNLNPSNSDYGVMLEFCNSIIGSYSDDIGSNIKIFELFNYYDSSEESVAVNVRFELDADSNKKADLGIRDSVPQFVLRYFKNPYPKSMKDLEFAIWQIKDNTIHEVQHIHQIILAKQHGKDERSDLFGLSSKRYHLKGADSYGKIKMPEKIDTMDKMQELLLKIKGMSHILTEPPGPKSSYLPERAKSMRIAQPLKEAEFYTILSDSVRVFNKNFGDLPTREKKEIASMIIDHDIGKSFDKNFANKLEGKLINENYKELINFAGWFFYLLAKYAPPGKWEKAVKEFYKGINQD